MYWPKPEALDGKWKAPPLCGDELTLAEDIQRLEIPMKIAALAIFALIGAAAPVSAADAVPVTADNFPRAEFDLYFGGLIKGQRRDRQVPASPRAGAH